MSSPGIITVGTAIYSDKATWQYKYWQKIEASSSMIHLVWWEYSTAV